MAIFIGTLVIELEVTDALTLKDKRHVVKSLLDRVRSKFNVSAAEVEQLNSVRHATLALAMVANERTFVDQVLAKVVDLVEAEPRAVLLDYQTEVL